MRAPHVPPCATLAYAVSRVPALGRVQISTNDSAAELDENSCSLGIAKRFDITGSGNPNISCHGMPFLSARASTTNPVSLGVQGLTIKVFDLSQPTISCEVSESAPFLRVSNLTIQIHPPQSPPAIQTKGALSMSNTKRILYFKSVGQDGKEVLAVLSTQLSATGQLQCPLGSKLDEKSLSTFRDLTCTACGPGFVSIRQQKQQVGNGTSAPVRQVASAQQFLLVRMQYLVEQL